MVAAAGFGIIIGAALGLLGGGGSILAVPALVYGVGESVPQAITTSLFVVGLSSGVGVIPRARAGQVRWPVAAVFGIAGVGTAFAGTAVNHLLSSRVLLLAFAVLMVAVAIRMLAGNVEPRGACAAPDGTVNWTGCLPKAVAAGAVVGFLTGLFGVGGGFVIVPALALLLGLEMNLAIGTSLIVIVINSAAGFLAHLQRTSVDWTIALVFAGAALIAALLAGRLGARVGSDRLRRWFAWLIIAVAFFVAVEAIVNPASLGK
jgi:uncharacterized membrane protein YfcA